MLIIILSEQEKYAQIIELQNESCERNVIASSLEDFIQINIDQLKNLTIFVMHSFKQWLNHSVYDF
ncbi:hypothetical protein ACNJC6_00638 [Acinetobacter johnsonii]|uniref:Uncharacterized protein n=1 Tax=Acinetobacter johnsonii TaxID=40214 RepID=A0A1R7Q9V6_ACIJO|nr:hypothetical protein ACNJC6_00638 [Acinetobacter johnsonii]